MCHRIEVILRLRVIFVAVVLLSAVTAFAQGDASDRGARQYATTCAGCHGSDGSGSVKGSAIATLPTVIALSDADLIGIVRNGVPGKGMPGLKALGDENIQAVVRYLRTLQGAAGAAASAKSSTNASGAPTVASPAQAETANAKTPKQSAATGSAGPGASAIASLDVQQSDLKQKEVRENWVSYNGDYSGRRFSAMTRCDAGERESVWRRNGSFIRSDAGVLEVTPVVVAGVMFVTRLERCLCAGREDGQAAVAPCARRSRRG